MGISFFPGGVWVTNIFDYLALAAIIDNKPRTARVITVTDCDFATVSMNDFKNCLAKFT